MKSHSSGEFEANVLSNLKYYRYAHEACAERESNVFLKLTQRFPRNLPKILYLYKKRLQRMGDW
jgi:hypothetical protein